MGLDINNYSADYSQLHRLRQWALNVEKNPRKLQCMDYGVAARENHSCQQCIYCLITGKVTKKDRLTVTRFYELIDHSDCEGGYISFNKFGIHTPKIDILGMWGNLDELKKEIKYLARYEDTLQEWDKQPWENFKHDVLAEEFILLFH